MYVSCNEIRVRTQMDSSKKRKFEENAVIVVSESIDREDVRKLLESLERDYMVEILQEAAMRNPELLEDVRRYADRDPAHRKLFVRGLGWDTTTETLKSVFSQYGELEEGVVIKDKGTQKSRGFGFVTFKHMDGALRALKEPSKRIDTRMTVCQLAALGPTAPQPVEDVAARKIYVGNVPMGLSSDKILSIFGQFGEIAEGPLGFDKTTGTSRGYALIIYKTADGARNALMDPVKAIDGHQVHCKLADNQKQGGKSEIDDMTHKQIGNGYGSSNRTLIGGLPLSHMNHQASLSNANQSNYQHQYPLMTSQMQQVSQQSSRVGMGQYGYASPVFGGQPGGYASSHYYGNPTSASLQPVAGSPYGVAYASSQQLTSGPRAQPVGVPSIQSNYSN